MPDPGDPTTSTTTRPDLPHRRDDHLARLLDAEITAVKEESARVDPKGGTVRLADLHRAIGTAVRRAA